MGGTTPGRRIGLIVVHGISDVEVGSTARRAAACLATDGIQRESALVVADGHGWGQPPADEGAEVRGLPLREVVVEARGRPPVHVIDAGWADLSPQPKGAVSSTQSWLKQISRLPDVALAEALAEARHAWSGTVPARVWAFLRVAAAVGSWWLVAGIGRSLVAFTFVAALWRVWGRYLDLMLFGAVAVAVSYLLVQGLRRPTPLLGLLAICIGSGMLGAGGYVLSHPTLIGHHGGGLWTGGDWRLMRVPGLALACVVVAGLAGSAAVRGWRILGLGHQAGLGWAGTRAAYALWVAGSVLGFAVFGERQLRAYTQEVSRVIGVVGQASTRTLTWEMPRPFSSASDWLIHGPTWRLAEGAFDLFWVALCVALLVVVATEFVAPTREWSRRALTAGARLSRIRAEVRSGAPTFAISLFVPVAVLWVVLHLGLSGLFGTMVEHERFVSVQERLPADARSTSQASAWQGVVVGWRNAGTDEKRLTLAGFTATRKPSKRLFSKDGLTRKGAMPLGDTDLVLFAAIVAALLALGWPAALNARHSLAPPSDTGARSRARGRVQREALDLSLAWGPLGITVAGTLIAIGLLCIRYEEWLGSGIDYPSRWAKQWLEPISYLAGSGFVLTASAWLAVLGKPADLLSDVVSFLDPTGDGSVRQRAKQRLERAVQGARAAGCDRIVLLAHSQGTVVVADYLVSCGDTDREGLRIMTCGSPLRHRYAYFLPFFTADTTRILDDSGPLTWWNLYFGGDYVGRDLWGESESTPVGRADFLVGSGGHTGYLDGPERGLVTTLLRNLVFESDDVVAESTARARGVSAA